MKPLSGEKLKKELLRLEGMKEYERKYASCGFICGIDEAGRGPRPARRWRRPVFSRRPVRSLYLNDPKS